MQFAILDDDGNIVCTNRGQELSMTEEEIVSQLCQKACDLLGFKGKKAAKLNRAVSEAWRWAAGTLKSRTVYRF